MQHVYCTTRGSHWEADCSVFVCKYDNGNFNGSITNFISKTWLHTVRKFIVVETVQRVSVSGTISLVRACKYVRSPWNKIASISVCVQESTESDKLKSKAQSVINAYCRPLECSLKASWPWSMLPRTKVIITDQQKRSKKRKNATAHLDSSIPLLQMKQRQTVGV